MPPKLHRNKIKPKTESGPIHFGDEQKSIDFVLVYKTLSASNDDNVEDATGAEARTTFELNLRKEGLELENTNDTNGNSFVKIYAPWSVISKYASIMKLKMPMKTNHSFDTLNDNKEEENVLKKFTTTYSRDKIYLFDIPDNREKFFSSAQRAQIVDFILKRTRFTNDENDAASIGIQKLLSDNIYVATFPLHEDMEKSTARGKLSETWASFSRIFTKQPLDEIRNYYGVKIGLYYAWLGFYTKMLIPASIIGFLCFIFGAATVSTDVPVTQLCSKEYDKQHLKCPSCAHDCNFTQVSDTCQSMRMSYMMDNPASVVFAAFMAIWAAVYLEMWKRYSSRITFQWDLSTYDSNDEYPRPEYLTKLSKAKTKINIITGLKEPVISFWKRKFPYTLMSSSVVLLLIFMNIGFVVSVIVYRASVRSAMLLNGGKNSFSKEYSAIISTSTGAALNLICIFILNSVYHRLAHWLTELESLRTQTDFDNSLTLKMFLLQFVNYYSSIFYIAFFKGRFVGHPGEFDKHSLTQEECSNGGCLLELMIQLLIIMVGKQAINAFMETGILVLKRLYNKYRYRKIDSVEKINVPQWEQDLILSPWETPLLFCEYLEIVIQFGFVTIFVSAFPLAPIFALINNTFEIRLDAKKMNNELRRPVAQRVKDIGIWYWILEAIGNFSVVTNAFIIAFTSEFIPRVYYYFEHGNMQNYLMSTFSLYDANQLNKQLGLNYNGLTQYCLYSDYREPPSAGVNQRYKETPYYWRLMTVRLAFVIVFVILITSITSFIRWLIPDVSSQLRLQMKQHAFLTNQLIMQHEAEKDNDTIEHEQNHVQTDKSDN